MPRSKRPSIASFKTGSFEPIRKNPISLLDDDFLDRHAKVIKIGEDNSPLSLSKTEFRIEGDLFLSGNLSSHTIKTENNYLDFVTGSYFRFYHDATASGDEYKIFWTGTSALHTVPGFIAFDTGEGIFKVTDDGDFWFEADGENRTLKLYTAGSTGADLFSIAVAADGVSTIATTDSDGTAANLTLDVDGDIELNADGGQVAIKDGTTSHFMFNCDNTRIVI